MRLLQGIVNRESSQYAATPKSELHSSHTGLFVLHYISPGSELRRISISERTHGVAVEHEHTVSFAVVFHAHVERMNPVEIHVALIFGGGKIWLLVAVSLRYSSNTNPGTEIREREAKLSGYDGLEKQVIEYDHRCYIACATLVHS